MAVQICTVMLNILQIPNKLYLAEHFVQTSGNSMNQRIGTSIPESWRRRMGGWGACSYQGLSLSSNKLDNNVTVILIY